MDDRLPQAPEPDLRQLSLFAGEPDDDAATQLSLLSPGPAAATQGAAARERRTRAAPAPPDGFRQTLAGFGELASLAEFARGCERCGLRAGCRGVVFGEGDPHARLLLVGEGPGAREDELGRPFVGRAGELLDRILAAAGFRREEVYITNVVMCRPPGNRTPEPAEVEACFPYLERKIELIDPAVIVALGATAARALLGPHARITAVRGRWHDYRGRPVMPTFHPALLLRDPSRKREVWQDFQAVRDAVRGARAG